MVSLFAATTAKSVFRPDATGADILSDNFPVARRVRALALTKLNRSRCRARRRATAATFRAGDAADGARAIRKLCGDRDLFNTLLRNAQREVLEKHTLDAMLDAIENGLQNPPKRPSEPVFQLPVGKAQYGKSCRRDRQGLAGRGNTQRPASGWKPFIPCLEDWKFN